MKIINCEQCFTSLPVSAGSYCKIMCNECGWTPNCDDGEKIDVHNHSLGVGFAQKDYKNVKERPIKTTCEKEELYKK